MKAVVLKETGGPDKVLIEQVDTPEPAAGEVRVKLHASALNRRDYWMTLGMYPGMQLPCIPGSDGAGVIDAVGDGVDQSQLGREVVIYPAREWGPNERAPGPAFRVLGMPDAGTFAEFIVTPADTVYDRPAHLSWEEAAAVPLAGLTSWRAAVTQGEVESGQTVLVTGAGGGVATFAIHWCVSKGAKVYVTSSSQDKLEAAKSIGAVGGGNYQDQDCYKQLRKEAGGFDVIIDSAGGEALNAVLDTLNMAGRYVFFGATRGVPSAGLQLPKLFFKQVRIQGTTMGSQSEFADMLEWLGQHKIEPVVDQALPLGQAQAALRMMEKMEQTGKIVLRNQA